jgi:hypothetical protein
MKYYNITENGAMSEITWRDYYRISAYYADLYGTFTYKFDNGNHIIYHPLFTHK